MLCLALAARAEPALVPPAPALAAPAAPQAAGSTQAAAAALPLRARLDRDAIRAAIAGLPTEKDSNPRRQEADTFGATPHQAFSQDFARARLPVCLHAEGLRNQPTFFLSGWIALPFVAVAKLRGVCR